MSRLCDYIGRCRRNQKHVRLLCKGHMLHTVLKIPVKSIYQTLISCQTLKGNGIDKVGGILRHDHRYIRFLLFQHTCKYGNLVSGNAACYAKYNVFSL